LRISCTFSPENYTEVRNGVDEWAITGETRFFFFVIKLVQYLTRRKVGLLTIHDLEGDFVSQRFIQFVICGHIGRDVNKRVHHVLCQATQ